MRERSAKQQASHMPESTAATWSHLPRLTLFPISGQLRTGLQEGSVREQQLDELRVTLAQLSLPQLCWRAGDVTDKGWRGSGERPCAS